LVDIIRPEGQRLRRNHFVPYIAIAVALLVASVYGFLRLKPAGPTLDRSEILIDTVKRGEMLRQVRGLGTLVPETVVMISAATDARVDHRNVLPGTLVTKNTVILELSNQELQQAALDARYRLREAEADYKLKKAQLRNELLAQQAKTAAAKYQYHSAEMERQKNEKLWALGLIPEFVSKTSAEQADELRGEYELAEKQVETFAGSVDVQLAAQRAKIDQQQALFALKTSQMNQLRVKPGIDGMLQELPVEVGQKVTAGTILARVAQPSQLKAELKIVETLSKDLRAGQLASIDTHNGVVTGHLTHVDPTVKNGSVTVDVSLDGVLPPGLRADLSIEGTIEVERLENVLYVARPVRAEANSTAQLFKVSKNGNDAVRVEVALGRMSTNTIEVLRGLNSGDSVVISDMSNWSTFERIRLR